MKTQAEYDAEDAAKWRLLLATMDSGDAIRVVMRGEGSGNAEGRTGGMYAEYGDEIVEHMVTSAHIANPEGLPFELRMLVDIIDTGE